MNDKIHSKKVFIKKEFAMSVCVRAFVCVCVCVCVCMYNRRVVNFKKNNTGEAKPVKKVCRGFDLEKNVVIVVVVLLCRVRYY